MKIAFERNNPNLFNCLVAWWTGGPYSHCEIIVGTTGPLNKYVTYSSSISDHGVRGKIQDLPSDMWDIIEVDYDVAKAEQWFQEHLGMPYDLLGLVGFVIREVPDEKRAYFCSESCAEAMGIPNAARLSPNDLYKLLTKK